MVLEFALVSLVLYLLIAGTVELGRAVFYAQSAQSAARICARELSLYPLPSTTQNLKLALNDAGVKNAIYDPAKLVIDLDALPAGTSIDDHFATLPLVNQALRPLMIFDEIEVNGSPRRLLRYPGALWLDPDGTLTVKVPRVDARGAGGVETITMLDVVEELSPGAFRLTTGNPKSGVAGVRINVPYQAAMMTGFQSAPGNPFAPNLDHVIVADDGSVTVANAGGGAPVGGASLTHVYDGPYGLGRQFALGKEVRPFRKLITAQAIFRREVFTN